MTTEQYAMIYETGYQDGWNSAMESLNVAPQPAKPAEQEPVAVVKAETLGMRAHIIGDLS